jgi:hypothetical protein
MIQVESLRGIRFRLWFSPLAESSIRFLLGGSHHFHSVPLVGSFEEADSSGIFQFTRFHVPWLNFSVPEEISSGIQAGWLGL